MKRVLIKLSGEALGLNGALFDFHQIDRVAKVIAEVAQRGTQVALVLGAGNIWRGRQGPSANMDAVTADHMGMLGTMINSLAMQDALRRAGQTAHVLSAVEMTRFADAYTQRDAMRLLAAGDIVLFACGTGNPFFSTDTAAALRAVEIHADAILLAKNIDGVYDDDPRKNPNAKLLPDLTYLEAQQRDLRVMDATALTICRENAVPRVLVFGLDEPENILRVLSGEKMGSVVHP